MQITVFPFDLVYWCSTGGLPFEESSARSSGSSDSHPLSPTSSMDTSTTDPLHPNLNPHHRNHPPPASIHPNQMHMHTHALKRDNSGSAGHSHRTDHLGENGGKAGSLDRGRTSGNLNDDRGSDRDSDRSDPTGLTLHISSS